MKIELDENATFVLIVAIPLIVTALAIIFG